MKLLIKWFTGSRTRAHFRMLVSTSAVERLSNDMLGAEQWVTITLPPKDIELIRVRAERAIAEAYVAATAPEVSILARIPAQLALVNGMGLAAEIGLLIDLGEVVMP